MNTPLIWLLITTLLFSSVPAFATTGTRATDGLPSRAQRMVENFNTHQRSAMLRSVRVSARDLEAEIWEAAREKPKAALASTGHTLLFILVLAGIDIVAQELKRTPVQNVVTPAHLSDLALKTSIHILDSPEVWTGIFVAGSFSLADKPANLMIGLFKNPLFKKTFAPVLARAITSTIAFVGWELGGQLWTEASYMLENQDDYLRAKSAIGMAHGILTTAIMAGSKPNAANAANARVARLMMKNMVQIVLFDSELRARWFENTWRLRVLTGEFTTMLSAMIASGLIGSAVGGAVGTGAFPGAGTLIGVIFGLVGGVTAIFVPQKAKDRITWGFQDMRYMILDLRLDANYSTLHDAVLPFRFASYPSDEARINQFKWALHRRHRLREEDATIEWERLYFLIQRAQSARRADFKVTVRELFTRLDALYADDQAQLRGLDPLLDSVSPPADLLDLQRKEIARDAMLRDVVHALYPEALSAFDNNQLIQFTESTRNRGFDELSVINEWIAAK